MDDDDGGLLFSRIRKVKVPHDLELACIKSDFFPAESPRIRLSDHYRRLNQKHESAKNKETAQYQDVSFHSCAPLKRHSLFQ
jgi:hypothetical protein